MLFIIRRLLNRLCSLLFCWQISAGRMRFDLIFCMRHKIFKFEKKEKPLVAHSILPASKQEEEEEEEEKEEDKEEETLLERTLLLLRKSSIATTCLSRERGSLFCVFEEFWQKESKEKISFSPPV